MMSPCLQRSRFLTLMLVTSMLLGVLGAVPRAALADIDPAGDACIAAGMTYFPETGVCTHGPDVSTGGDKTASEPLPDSLTAASLPCDGDGVSGDRVQVLYVRGADKPNRFGANLASFRLAALGADEIFFRSAQETGGIRHIRFVQDASCQLAVGQVVIPAEEDDSMDEIVASLQQQGHNRTDRKYLVFSETDIPGFAGQGTLLPDSQPGQNNANNAGTGYAVIYTGGSSSSNIAQSAHSVAHELGHVFGAVQPDAPHSSNGIPEGNVSGHCFEENDVMCYPDFDSDGDGFADAPTMEFVCTTIEVMDCNHDDYFSTNPPPGSYLATHWNIANSRFLSKTSNGCPDEATEPDDGPGQAGDLPVDSEEWHAFCSPADEDWFNLALFTGYSYRIETLQLDPAIDTVLTLMHKDGGQVAHNDDRSSSDRSSVITYSPTCNVGCVFYQLRVRNTGAAGITGSRYLLRVTVLCTYDSYEDDDSAAQARPVTHPIDERHGLCEPGDEDWVKLNLLAGNSLRFETHKNHDQAAADTILDLYDAALNLLASDDDSGSESDASLIDYTIPTSGTYYLRARLASGNASGYKSYNLRITSLNPPPAMTVPELRLTTGQTIGNANPFGNPVYTVNVQARWSSGDPDGVVSQQLQRLNATGFLFTDVSPQPAPNATQQDIPVKFGATIQVRVRAVDGLGNTSPYYTSAHRTVTVADDTSSTWAYTGAWEQAKANGALGGLMMVLARGVEGDMAVYNFVGGSAALVGAVRPDGGMADIYVDGKLMDTVDFYSASTRNVRQVVFAVNGLDDYALDWRGQPSPHTLTVRWRAEQNPASSGSVLYLDAGIALTSAPGR
jgi:hypothetical protein